MDSIDAIVLAAVSLLLAGLYGFSAYERRRRRHLDEITGRLERIGVVGPRGKLVAGSR
jgi:hypothetical protein